MQFEWKTDVYMFAELLAKLKCLEENPEARVNRIVRLSPLLLCGRCRYLLNHALSLCNPHDSLRFIFVSSHFHPTFQTLGRHSSNIDGLFYAPSLVWLRFPPSLHPLSSSRTHLSPSEQNSVLTPDLTWFKHRDGRLGETSHYDFCRKKHYWYVPLLRREQHRAITPRN